jgi:hypothetical protein
MIQDCSFHHRQSDPDPSARLLPHFRLSGMGIEALVGTRAKRPKTEEQD